MTQQLKGTLYKSYQVWVKLMQGFSRYDVEMDKKDF